MHTRILCIQLMAIFSSRPSFIPSTGSPRRLLFHRLMRLRREWYRLRLRGREPMHFSRPKMSWCLPCINSIKRSATPGEVSSRIHFAQIDLLIDFISALCPQFCGFSVVIVRGKWVLLKDTRYLFTVCTKCPDLIALVGSSCWLYVYCINVSLSYNAFLVPVSHILKHRCSLNF